ncbi:hypothetical protein WME97_12880 [Sorangium sp. So ce367]|uniref:hypothetical protein n=1 Tax=Sorangium sp. So ce367 TaxID=3133305 RepID=UPI003F626337
MLNEPLMKSNGAAQLRALHMPPRSGASPAKTPPRRVSAYQVGVSGEVVLDAAF